MKKTKKTVLLEFWYKTCVTLKIYAKLNKANWKLKFKPQKVQDLISNLALELHQNSAPINCDNFSKSLPLHCFSRVRILHSVRISFIIFFCILSFSILIFLTLL